LFRTRLVLDVLINPKKSHGHRTWCRGARAVPPWACLPGWRLGPLHRVLPRIWPYLGGKHYELNMGKYSARPITLSNDGILTNCFLRLNVGRWRCGLRYRASKSRNARASYWHKLAVSIFSVSPLVENTDTVAVCTVELVGRALVHRTRAAPARGIS
jgi:hypothetical protein